MSAVATVKNIGNKMILCNFDKNCDEESENEEFLQTQVFFAINSYVAFL